MTRSVTSRLRKRRTVAAARAAGAGRTATSACSKWCRQNTLIWTGWSGANRPESGNLPLRILQDPLSPRSRATAAELHVAQLAYLRRNSRGPLAAKRMDLRLEPRHAAGDCARHARSAG